MVTKVETYDAMAGKMIRVEAVIKYDDLDHHDKIPTIFDDFEIKYIEEKELPV